MLETLVSTFIVSQNLNFVNATNVAHNNHVDSFLHLDSVCQLIYGSCNAFEGK
jgi:hypothetical protein